MCIPNWLQQETISEADVLQQQLSDVLLSFQKGWLRVSEWCAAKFYILVFDCSDNSASQNLKGLGFPPGPPWENKQQHENIIISIARKKVQLCLFVITTDACFSFHNHDVNTVPLTMMISCVYLSNAVARHITKWTTMKTYWMAVHLFW